MALIQRATFGLRREPCIRCRRRCRIVCSRVLYTMNGRSGAAADENAASVKTVKVFSATKARDRAILGERVTEWLSARPGIQVLDIVVAQSSDREFHCLSIVLLCGATAPEDASVAKSGGG